jgi:hypothetical protein
MSTDKTGGDRDGFEIPCELHETAEFDAAADDPERFARCPIVGFVFPEVVWDVVELTGPSPDTPPRHPDADAGGSTRPEGRPS